MSAEEQKVVRLPLPGNEGADGDQSGQLSQQHAQAAQPPAPTSGYAVTPKPFAALPIRISYSLNAVPGAGYTHGAQQQPAAEQSNAVPTVKANDTKLSALRNIIGGMLYRDRYDALVKLLSDNFVQGLSNTNIEGTNHTALEDLLNGELYLYVHNSRSMQRGVPKPSSNAYLINYLCSLLNDEVIDEMHSTSQQRYVREAIRTLLDIDTVDCTKQAHQRKEEKPFFYIATSGNVEFVRLFIEKRIKDVPEIHSPEGEAIVEGLRNHFLAKHQGATRAEATERANEIVALISQATTQRNLETGAYGRISADEFIAQLMHEAPTPFATPAITAAPAAKKLAPPKRARAKKDNKPNDLAP